MRKVLKLADIGEVADYIDEKVFSYIAEKQIESFECMESFDLLAFDLCDIRNDDGKSPKVIIYLDRSDLFFFCESDGARERVEKLLSQVLADETEPCENEMLLYAFFVRLLKGDMDVLDDFEQQLGASEYAILSEDEKAAADKISSYRRKLLHFKRYYEQLDSIFDEMTANDNDLFSDRTVNRLAILGRRTDRYLREIESLCEIVDRIDEAYRSQLSIRQNELMKVFTVITAIFLPLTLITGWYGMNFAGMHELESEYGYPAVIAVSAVIVILLVRLFKKKKWL